ncbi:MAG: MFS transporter [Candidatus Woesearchaeota archaeon]
MSYHHNISRMYLFEFLLSLHFVSGVLVPFFMSWGKLSFLQVMLLQSFYVIISFLLEIPTGAVADHLGRKTSLILAALSVALGVLIYSSSPNFYLFFLAEFFWAMGLALLSGADEALIYDSLKEVKKERTSKKIFGRLETFGLAGLAIAAPIGSIIATYLGLRYTMMLMAIPFFLAFLIAFTLKEPKTKQKVESTRYLQTLIKGVRYFKEHKVLRILAFDHLSTTSLIFFIIWIYQPFLTQLSFPLVYFGLVHATISIIQIIFVNRFRWLEGLFRSKKNYLLYSALIPGLAFILLGFVSSSILAISLIWVIAGFGLTRRVLFRNYYNKYIPSEHRATTISSISMLSSFVSAILYPLIGLLVEKSLNYTFIILGILIIALAILSKVEEHHLID